MPVPRFQLRWHKEDGDDHVIPADLLSEALSAAQEAFRLAGLHAEGLDERQRARIPADIAERYTVRCEAARTGSYALPLVLGREDLADDAHLAEAASIFERGIEFAQGGIEDPFAPMGPAIRRAFIRSIDNVIPPRGRGWDLDVTFPSGKMVRLSEDSHRRLDERRLQFEVMPTAVTRTLTGELTKINFAERLLTFVYPIDNRELHCSYTDDEEVRLLDSRRDQIHVTGRVILDERGRPIRVDEVERIERLDLSPIEITRLDLDGRLLRARAPISLVLVQEEESAQQWITLRQNALGLETVAATRSQLVDSVRDEIRMLWREYARAPSETLTQAGQHLKGLLRDTFEEAEYAA